MLSYPHRARKPSAILSSELLRRASLLGALALFLGACETTTKDLGTDYELMDSKEESILDSRLKYLNEEAEKYPKRDDLHYRIAGVYFLKTDYNESARSLERAIALSPEEAKYHYQLGRVYLKMRELDRAEEHFRKATRLGPGDRYTGPQASLAYVLSLKKDHAGAVEGFRKCTEIDPENPVFYYALGAQYDILGDKEAAIRSFQEYLNRGGTTYKKSAIFILENLGVKVEERPSRFPGRSEDSWGLDLDGPGEGKPEPSSGTEAPRSSSRSTSPGEPGSDEAGDGIDPLPLFPDARGRASATGG